MLTYEEIARYYPQPNRKRPIVLIGPSNVGRQELQQRLTDSDPDRFGAPIPRKFIYEIESRKKELKTMNYKCLYADAPKCQISIVHTRQDLSH